MSVNQTENSSSYYSFSILIDFPLRNVNSWGSKYENLKNIYPLVYSKNA